MVVPLPAAVKLGAAHVIGARGKKLVKYAALRTRLAFGGEPFTSDHGLDRAVLQYLPQRPGFFIEAGANDGFSNANTFYLEKRLGWRGLLVEPIPQLARFARRVRNVPVVEAALGAPENDGDAIELAFADMTSRVGTPPAFVRWGGWFGDNPRHVIATCRTLSGILEEAGDPEVDFLSLDVEGFEIPALSGLDLDRHAPAVILVETAQPEAVASLIGPRYTHVAEPFRGDHLFLRS